MKPTRSLAGGLWRSLRPHQWVKNVLVFGGLVFAGQWNTPDGLSDGRLNLPALLHVTAAFVLFCALSSAGYLVNDIRDREADRQHHDKRHRPIASGLVPVPLAVALALALFALGLVGSALLVSVGDASRLYLGVALGYALLTNWYSFQLKEYVIIDVLTIAVLFVLRVLAGCWVIPVPPSHWIIVCTFFGALFIALCKRRAELVEMETTHGHSRPVLEKYRGMQAGGAELLDQMLQMAGTATILTYSLYTFFRPQELGVIEEQGGLMFTIPFVVYGVFRYLYLVHKREVGQKPERLFRDPAMLLNLALWALVALLVTRGRNL